MSISAVWYLHPLTEMRLTFPQLFDAHLWERDFFISLKNVSRQSWTTRMLPQTASRAILQMLILSYRITCHFGPSWIWNPGNISKTVGFEAQVWEDWDLWLIFQNFHAEGLIKSMAAQRIWATNGIRLNKTVFISIVIETFIIWENFHHMSFQEVPFIIPLFKFRQKKALLLIFRSLKV